MARWFFKFIPVCLAALFLLAQAGAAGAELVMRMSLSARLEGGRLMAGVEVLNQGDEDALGLGVELLYPVKFFAQKRIHRLEPGARAHWDLSADLGAHQPPSAGAVVARLRFTDFNLFPLSSLAHGFYGQPGGDVSGIQANAEGLALRRSGELRLVLANEGAGVMSVRSLLFTPAELRAAAGEQVCRIEQGGRKTLGFEITNISALPGSSYPVLFVIERAEGAGFQPHVVRSDVKVKKAVTRVDRAMLWWLLALAGLLSLVFLAWNLYNRRA